MIMSHQMGLKEEERERRLSMDRIYRDDYGLCTIHHSTKVNDKEED